MVSGAKVMSHILKNYVLKCYNSTLGECSLDIFSLSVSLSAFVYHTVKGNLICKALGIVKTGAYHIKINLELKLFLPF